MESKSEISRLRSKWQHKRFLEMTSLSVISTETLVKWRDLFFETRDFSTTLEMTSWRDFSTALEMTSWRDFSTTLEMTIWEISPLPVVGRNDKLSEFSPLWSKWLPPATILQSHHDLPRQHTLHSALDSPLNDHSTLTALSFCAQQFHLQKPTAKYCN